MKKILLDKRFAYVVYGLLLLAVIGVFALFSRPLSNSRVYENDVKVISYNTKIEVYYNKKKYSTIDGNFLNFFVDPLKMTKDGNVIARAGDNYNFILQDDHVICINGNIEVVMKGDIPFAGQSYDLYDSNDKYIGKAIFNGLNTTGSIYDKDKKEIARYTSLFLMRDYKVYIRDNDSLSDDAILMIFASYYSDQKYDNAKNNNINNSKN